MGQCVNRSQFWMGYMGHGSQYIDSVMTYYCFWECHFATIYRLFSMQKKTLCVDSMLVTSLQLCRTLRTACSLKLYQY